MVQPAAAEDEQQESITEAQQQESITEAQLTRMSEDEAVAMAIAASQKVSTVVQAAPSEDEIIEVN